MMRALSQLLAPGGGCVCKIHTELELAATAVAVWDVLGDFARWSDWQDFMELPVLPQQVGRPCRVVFKLDGGCMKRSTHEPEILVLDAGRELRWRDYRGPLVSRFFRGSHWWTLEALPSGGTRLVHGAEMEGWVVPFLQATMDATRRSYAIFNAALAAEVARRHAAQP